MIVDTSALLAILQDEPERRAFNEAIEAADACRMSAATFVETSIVVDARFGAEGLQALDRLIEIADIEIVPVDLTQARAARDAYRRFGKGCDPAGLNYGDCFSYALAAVLREPLLFKGTDFEQTDVAPVVSHHP
ncbi:MAG: type II toxin-antitoxin system VapC family toxin [Burkholderiales bacterium]|nr:type II toxin-antitoxin system VapC family toxin [Burkholderiales bacterium]